MSDLVQPDMSQLPHLYSLMQEAWEEWAAAEATYGEPVAGDPMKYLATAILIGGYARRTIEIEAW